MPGVTIGDNVIIGANSTVTHDIPSNSVVVGSPAKLLCTLDEYIRKEKERMDKSRVYDDSFTLRCGITMEKRIKQREDLEGNIGYII